MFVLAIFEKIKETERKFSKGSSTVLEKMATYKEAINKLANNQLVKLQSATKTGTILTITKKNFQDVQLPHELFLTTT